jgi:hypothetical protein
MMASLITNAFCTMKSEMTRSKNFTEDFITIICLSISINKNLIYLFDDNYVNNKINEIYDNYKISSIYIDMINNYMKNINPKSVISIIDDSSKNILLLKIILDDKTTLFKNKPPFLFFQ